MSTVAVISGIFVLLILVCGTWFGIPGTFLISIGALIWGWSTGFILITPGIIITCFVISVFLELLEIFFSGLMVKFSGGSKKTAVFAILGGFIGAILGTGFLFLIGAFLGLLIGSFLGALFGELMSGKTVLDSMKISLSTIMGNIAAKLIKSTTVIVMGIWIFTITFS